MKNITTLCICFFSIVLSSMTYAAGITIEITQGTDDPVPIAIVPIAGITTPSGEDIAEIIRTDLLRSGLFAPTSTDNMLSFPKNEMEIFYRDWRKLGVEYLMIGRFAREIDGYALSYELYNVVSQQPVFKKVTRGNRNTIRDIAHAASDQVFEAITDIRGVFSTKMLYIEDRGVDGPARYRLMRADIDGEREKIVFKSSQPLLSPTWSHDLRQVAYVSFETTRPAIFRHDLITGAREQLTNFKGLNGAPTWSPDGKKMAFTLSKDGNPELYTLDIATKKLTRVTKHFAIDTEPNWLPDGKSLIFTSNRGGSPQIYQIGLASGRVERLTFEGNYNARPRISPDGKSFVMVHRQDSVYQIALQEIKTGNIRVLTETDLDESPTIAPNGAMILYATKHNNKGVLAAVSMDAGLKFRLPSKVGDIREPAWSPFIK